ncbi:class I SAM-dependent methyltransferase [Microterricola viridarii]|uniref:Methyltransferase small domain-containing protein n=1 Tax=Microterricola viridarii TaxID=412690 RepID=A0A1H1X1H6_9MICO|nr:methyltransferase [Microterricola viridarii]SDT02486.1 Methyltransferase small domain-containing protein [Microterricola viridarii]
MASEHYFSADPGSELKLRRIQVRLGGQDREVTTSNGIFSPDHIDQGTEVLLRYAPTPPATGNLLDLGCGWGPIALTLALESPEATVWAVDVNDRALELVRRNAEELGLGNVRAVRPEDVPEDVRFETIWSNPPIRVGKDVLHSMLQHWLPRLKPGTDSYLVVQRNLGSDSLQRWLEAEFAGSLEIAREAISKGFRVLKVTRPDAAE